LSSLWPQLVLVIGRPNHQQSHDEPSNGDCEAKFNGVAERQQLSTVAQWCYGTRFVQETINSTYHEAIKCHCTKHLLEINPFVAAFTILNKVRTTTGKGDVEVLLDNGNNQGD